MSKNLPNLKVAPSSVAPTKIGLKVTETEKPSRVRRRRWSVFLSFLLIVVAPTVMAAAYLYRVALDQYHSVAAFSIRSEETINPFESLGAITDIHGTSAPDSTILYDFIRSQHIVENLDARLDLQAMFSPRSDDVVFTLSPDARVEDRVEYWRDMVSVWTDSGGNIVNIEVRAFSPGDATAIAEAIVEESTELVNDLNQIAQQDAMRFANEDLRVAQERLREVRQNIRQFRTERQIINPEADVDSQMGVIAALQTRLAELLIRRGSLLDYSETSDARAATLDREIRAIRAQIAAERETVSEGGSDGISLSSTIGAYEELLVDLKFSEDAYTLALAAAEKARAEARRQSRYAAVHIPPTRAEESIFPRRELIVLFVALGALTTWAALVLIFYNIRDRA